jgi:hypothetical protein
LGVESTTGTPGFDAESNEKVLVEQVRVREYDWYSIYPPSVAELTPAQ